MPPNKTYYTLADAAERAQCESSDLIDYASQRLIPLLVGVPDWVDILVYDASTEEDIAPFLMSPELLVLDPQHCQKILLTGKTHQSDFREGYIVGSNGQFKKLLPSFGYPGMAHKWAYWRIYHDSLVYLLELVPERLFVLHEDLERLIAVGTTQAEDDREKGPSKKTKKRDVASGGQAPATEPEVPVERPDAWETVDIPPEAVPVPAKEGRVAQEDVPPPIPLGIVILRLKQVIEVTGLSRSTIYDMLDKKSTRYDPSFPVQKRISLGTVGWLKSEIQTWLAARRAVGSF